MDNTLTPLSPLLQTGSPTPVDRVNARLLVAGASSAASVAPADTLAANDVIELSPAARLLSAASASQSLGSNPQGFSSVLGAAINFASAFNSFNSLSGLGNNNNALPGFSTGGSDLGDIFSLPGTLGSLGQSADTSGTDLLLQALTNTPLNAAASAGNGNGNGATLLTGLANVGITLQSSGQLPTGTTASLVVDPLKLQSAFNANPAATSAVLAQAASSFAPLAASLVAQSNNFFLTQQDLNSSTGIEDIFTTQLELQLAAARLPLPTAVTAANAALQKTLQDEALSEAIVSAQNAALAEVQASAAANAAGANNSTIQATAPAAPTAPTTPTTASTAATPQQDNSDDTATPAQAASSAVAAPAADTNAAASTVARIASAISTPLSANGGPDAATTVATPAPAAATATAATTAVAQSPATASQTPSNLTTPSTPSALTQAQNIATQNALNDAAAAALLVQQNAADNAQAADADADADNAQQTGNSSTLAPAQATTVATTAATVNSTIPVQPAAGTTVDNTLLTGLEQANADALAGAAAVPATANAETTDQAANTTNPEANPALDPAFAAAIAAYSLRAPVANIVDDRNARELGKPAVEAVNSVESVSAVQPVTLDVHDEVAAARRNEMLRNDTARS